MKYTNSYEMGNVITLSDDQVKNEITYKKSLRLLGILKMRNIITHEQFKEIDVLNKISFSKSG